MFNLEINGSNPKESEFRKVRELILNLVFIRVNQQSLEIKIGEGGSTEGVEWWFVT